MDKEVVCYCNNVSKERILKAVKNGARSVSDIQKMTKACTGNRCKELNPKKRCCYEDVVEILKKNTEYAESDSCCCGGGGGCC